MTKRTQLHRKLLLEHKTLSNKYKLLRAKLDQVADSALKAEELEKRQLLLQQVAQSLLALRTSRWCYL